MVDPAGVTKRRMVMVIRNAEPRADVGIRAIVYQHLCGVLPRPPAFWWRQISARMVWDRSKLQPYSFDQVTNRVFNVLGVGVVVTELSEISDEDVDSGHGCVTFSSVVGSFTRHTVHLSSGE